MAAAGMDLYDALEARDPAAREKALLEALPRQVAHAKANAPGFARILRDIDPASVTTRAALAKLPVTRKSDLGDLQKAAPPLGGLNAVPLGKFSKIFISPGPIYDPEGTQYPDESEHLPEYRVERRARAVRHDVP